MATRKNATEKLAEGVYRRNGRVFVPMRDAVTGKRPYHYPVDYDLPNTKDGGKRLKRLLEDQQIRRGSPGETVAGFASRWVSDYPASAAGKPRGESTRTHNRERIKAFARDFGHKRLSEVTRSEARAWILGGVIQSPEVKKQAALWEGAKRLPNGDFEVPTHRGNYTVVRAMFNDALSDGVDGLRENPFTHVHVPRSDGRRGIVVLTEAEVARLGEVAMEVLGPDYGPQFRAVILTAAWTGIRPGELFALRWSDVDFRKLELTVREQYSSRLRKYGPTKSGEARTVVLLPPAADALRAIPRAIHDDLVFHTKQGKPFRGRNLGWYWDKVRNRFLGELPEGHHLKQRISRDPSNDFDFYELRHFCATYLLDRLQLTHATVAIQLGHTDGGRQVMQTYGHPDHALARDRIRQAYQQAGGAAARSAS